MKISKIIEEYQAEIITHYPNELSKFLGGEEQLKKVNIFGHRIIFVMMEMLKTLQVHKISKDEAKEIILNDLIIKNGRMMSLQEIRDEEIEKRRIIESGKNLAIIEEEYFRENFNMLQLVIPTKALNDNGKIKVKDNSVFHEQLKVLKTIGNHTVESKISGEVLITNFIETPIYNKGDSYIRFYISKQTSRMLLNTIEGYAKVYRTLLFSSPTPMPLNVFLYIKRKFGKMSGGNIKIVKFIEELGLPVHYLKKSKLSIFLKSIQKNLNDFSNISFGYEILDDSINFALYDTKNTIGIEVVSNEEYQANNAIKYIKKNRKLNEYQIGIVKKSFSTYGYKKMSVITKIGVDKSIIGDEYLKWFVQECIKNNLI